MILQYSSNARRKIPGAESELEVYSAMTRTGAALDSGGGLQRKSMGSGCSASILARSTSRTVSKSNPAVAAGAATSAQMRPMSCIIFPLLEEIGLLDAHKES
jgi:hypothetical protein